MVDKYNINRGLSDFFDEAISDDSQPGALYQEVNSCLERYNETGELGIGGMKKITLVSDRLTGRQVAKAVLKKDADSRTVERFLREARINASLEHPNIIPIHDLGIDSNGEAFFTMKVVHGKNFKQYLDEIKAENQALDLSDLLDMFVKICDAVAYAHANHIIHMDLKPENIQLSHFGEVLVCDWGLARDLKDKEEQLSTVQIVDQFVTQDGLVRGTPGYMSPEQAEGSLSRTGPHSDIYALGAILYSILTLEAPCRGSVDEVLEMTRRGDVLSPMELKPNLAIPVALQAVCQKAMALKTTDRYRDVEALKKDILAYLHGFATSAEDAGFFGLVKLLIKRNKAIALVAAFFSLLVIFGTSYFLLSLKISAAQARSAESAAKSSLEKLQKSEVLKNRLTKEAAPRILERVAEALRTYEFNEGMNLVNFALDLDYSLIEAHKRKGYFHLSLFEFPEALEEFKISGMGEEHKTIIACRDLIKKFGSRRELSLDEITWVISRYHELNKRQMINETTFSPRLDFLTLDERREYALVVLKIQNPQLREIHFVEDRVILDWSKLKDINGLYKTGITELDMSRAKITSNVIAIKGLPLRKLVWPNSKPGTYFKYIKRCKTLEVLHLPRKHVDKEALKLVPPQVKIIYY